MKKILFATLLVTAFGLSAYSADFASGSMQGFGSAYGDISGMQNPNSQLKLLEEQKFRQEEYNEFEDMKQVKARRNKKIELEQQLNETRTQPAYTNPQKIEFVRENGKLILRQVD